MDGIEEKQWVSLGANLILHYLRRWSNLKKNRSFLNQLNQDVVLFNWGVAWSNMTGLTKEESTQRHKTMSVLGKDEAAGKVLGMKSHE